MLTLKIPDCEVTLYGWKYLVRTIGYRFSFDRKPRENRRGNESVDWFLVTSRVFMRISLIIPESKRFLIYFRDGRISFRCVFEVYEIYIYFLSLFYRSISLVFSISINRNECDEKGFFRQRDDGD